MIRFSILFCFFYGVLGAISAAAQGFQVVFPGLTGNDLIDSVARNYRPDVVLDYAQSRDTLYRLLATEDDSIRCIYSGHTLYLDPTQDPTQFVYQNGGSNGINTEHAYPQSKGAVQFTNAHSDMHHLYPTRISVNEARGDKPFAEIPDAQTQKWFLKNQVFTSIPTENIQLYAESGSATFEPRESVKGDIARSILYFYTVYRSQANAADPNFFNIQRAALCQWDAQDPVDSAELRKTWRIAPFQDGNPNPFVIDCTLAYRSWCPEVPSSCTVGTKEAPIFAKLDLRLSPQPSSGQAVARLNLPFSGRISGRILNVMGQELAVLEMLDAQAGYMDIPIDFSNLLSAGIWMGFLELRVVGEKGAGWEVIPVLISEQ
jgi:endonuclease I